MRKPKLYTITTSGIIYDEMELIHMYFQAIGHLECDYESDSDRITLKHIRKGELDRLKKFIGHIEYARMNMKVKEESDGEKNKMHI